MKYDDRCYRADCKAAGECQNPTNPQFVRGLCCKSFGYPQPRLSEVEIVGPPLPPLPKNVRGFYPTWRRIYRREWLRQAMAVAGKLCATAHEFRHVTWRAVGKRHGLPDHRFNGEVVRQAVQLYANEHQVAFPYRARGEKIRGPRG